MLIATFASGMRSANVGVPVINDNITEGTLRFNLLLYVPSSLGPAIAAGDRSSAVGVITDSTSKIFK